MKKRILSLALILILCLSICTAALAATRQAGGLLLYEQHRALGIFQRIFHVRSNRGHHRHNSNSLGTARDYLV